MPIIVCTFCGNSFQSANKRLNYNLKSGRKNYCSTNCRNKSGVTQQTVSCNACGVSFKKQSARISKMNFCSLSCSATYNNRHKSHGYRRSKIESEIEKRLSKQFPNLEILYNSKSAIDSELDIYIPALRLALPLN